MTEHHEEYGKCHEKCLEQHHCCKEKMHHEEFCCGPEKFLKLAGEAWMELLKDKIKEQIEKKKGEEINKLAEIIADANGEKWKHKMQMKIRIEEYKDTLKDYYFHK